MDKRNPFDASAFRDEDRRKRDEAERKDTRGDIRRGLKAGARGASSDPMRQVR